MENNFVPEPRNRIQVFPVVAGIMLSVASMFFCMSLAAALGYWSFQSDELPMLGPAFWNVASISWAASVFVGCIVSAMASKAVVMKDGILTALVTWAGSYLLFGGIALSIVQTNLNAMLGAPTVGLFWHGFFGDALALICGIGGGVFGVYAERGHEHIPGTEDAPEYAHGVGTYF